MKKTILIFGMTLILSVSCKSQESTMKSSTYDSKSHIVFNLNFVSSIKDLLFASKKETLEKERTSFINQKINNDEYLKNLNLFIQSCNEINDVYNENFLNKVIEKRKKNNEVKAIYFVNLFKNELTSLNIVLVENFDRTVEIFNSEVNKVNIVDTGIIDFTDDFMFNIPYSYHNKTPSQRGYLSIYKITSTEENNYVVTSVIVLEVLDYQLKILEKFYKLSQD